ncbi:MAG: putative inner membrane transporter YedA [bacterium]|nr:putative inner membrane transporter YedA [bacterium]
MQFPRTDKAPNVKTLLAFFAIYFIWGSTYLAIKYAVETIPPFVMMGTRSLVAGAVLFFWSRWRGETQVRKEHWPSLLVIGALFFLVGHGALAWAQQRVSSGMAALLVASEPLWIALIESSAIRNFKIGANGVIGLVLGFAGMVVLIAPSHSFGAEPVNIMGTAAILLGTISWSSGAVYLRVAKLPKSSILSAGLELIIGGVLLYGAALVSGEFAYMANHAVSMRSVLALAYLIVFGSIIAFTAYVWLLSQTSATRTSTHTYVNPIIAVILGWAFAQEAIAANTMIAAVIIMVSVYLVLKKKSPKAAETASITPVQEPELVQRSRRIYAPELVTVSNQEALK